MSASPDPTLYDAWWRALPDARVSPMRRRTVMGPLGPMTDAFCCNCGGLYGLVTADFLDHVLVLCEPCAATHGQLPLQPVPPGIERAMTQKEG